LTQVVRKFKKLSVIILVVKDRIKVNILGDSTICVRSVRERVVRYKVITLKSFGRWSDCHISMERLNPKNKSFHNRYLCIP
jgi:hypothetical protein